jgi:regulation of enolase protein 1 (concanavalin A-like superfamily)
MDVAGDELLVEAAEGSDLWRTTSYGFIHDTGHALLKPFADGRALEVSFLLDYTAQFDQAGLLVRTDARHWIKAGVEVSDGHAHLGAVVTREVSDWSLAPVTGWMGQQVTIRASRTGDAVTIRGRVRDEAWQLVRVVPLPQGQPVLAGLYCCAPTRSGLVVRFRQVRFTEVDAALHP